MRKKILWGVLGSALFGSAPLFASSFTIKDIRIEGLQRISAGAVYNALPLQTGDGADSDSLAAAAHALFKTGNFQDIKLLREGNTLIVQVSERPAISKIELDGNKSINKDQLLKGLSEAGLSIGSVFQRATLDRVKLELERQYVAQGRYGASVTPTVKPLPRNRVELDIKIKEGDVATIAAISIVGNTSFDEEKLLNVFELKESHLTSFFTSDDKYSREKLSGDLENLSSYYMDRGYVNFVIDSTQVAVTPDKSQVYINVNVTEGDKFTVRNVKLAGDLKVDEKELSRLLLVRKEQTFSRHLVTLTNELISKRLGNEGYTFANVNGVPEINADDKTVDVTFYVDPGNRMYVRRIGFAGNDKSKDEVLRREMRQMESAWANGQLIELSKTRLERLGFFKTVNVETTRVPGETDQVDVNYTVEEQPSGSISASIGFQQGTGFVFGASVSQNNFLGTGNRVSFGLNRSQYRDAYNFSFLDPYYTIDGVSRGYSLYYVKSDIQPHLAISTYALDRLGGNLNFGYPIGETQRLNFGVGYENTRVYAPSRAPLEVWDFVGYDLLRKLQYNEETQAESFNSYTLQGSWVSSTLNRGVFATDGSQHTIAAEIAVPGSDLDYYKLTYSSQLFFPISGPWTVRWRNDMGFGDGYGDSSQLPFYRNFYSGGFGSVRGYQERALGPRETQSPYDYGRPDAIGGNMLLETGLELIFPTPFVEDDRSVRTALFIETGNVFDTHRTNTKRDVGAVPIELAELRSSVGVSLSWLTAIGPLAFSLSKPINDQHGDRTQMFQFSLGQPF
ncbi:outer membrane protein, bacterial surface antigen family [gamma proteobacterium HdN1]|nr:outer membrane protein, bacterial surface antigen family [gamma proteobacterium HdN1]